MANIFQTLLEQLYPSKGKVLPLQERTSVHARARKQNSGSRQKEQSAENTHEQERTQRDVEKEDFLISQIEQQKRARYRNCSL